MLLYDYVNPDEKKPSNPKNLNLQRLRKFFKKNSQQSPVVNQSEDDDDESRFSAGLDWLLTVPLDDENNEEVAEDFVTTLKVLLMEMSADDLNLLLGPEEDESLLLKSLQKFEHHNNLLIRNTARLCFLTVFKSCRGDFTNFIVEKVLLRHLESMISSLEKSISDLHVAMKWTKDKHRARLVCESIDAELEYVDDIFCLDNEIIAGRARSVFFRDFVFKSLFKSLVGKKQEVAMFNLCQLMSSVFNWEFKRTVLNCFIPVELNPVLENSDSDSEHADLRNQMIEILKKAVCGSNNAQLLALRFLNSLYESSTFDNNMEAVNLLHETYLESILHVLHKEKPFYENENEVIYLITSMLGYVVEKRPPRPKNKWYEHTMHILKEVKAAYVKICKSFQIKSTARFASILDNEYEFYLKKQETTKRILKESNSLVDVIIDRKENNTISFQVLFYLRALILQICNEEELVLPLLKRKVPVGKPLDFTHGIPCRKLVHVGKFAPSHYMLLTSSQVLVLQDVSYKRGLVIFNSYLKDVRLKKFKENCLVLCDEGCRRNQTEKHVSMKLLLKFKSSSVVETVVKNITKAKDKQNGVIEEKISNLLKLKFGNSDGDY